MIAVMGPEAAVNAVFANKIAGSRRRERAAYVEQLREEYRADIDLLQAGARTCTSTRWCPATSCAPSWCRRLAAAASKSVTGYPRRRSVFRYRSSSMAGSETSTPRSP